MGGGPGVAVGTAVLAGRVVPIPGLINIRPSTTTETTSPIIAAMATAVWRDALRAGGTGPGSFRAAGIATGAQLVDTVMTMAKTCRLPGALQNAPYGRSPHARRCWWSPRRKKARVRLGRENPRGGHVHR